MEENDYYLPHTSNGGGINSIIESDRLSLLDNMESITKTPLSSQSRLVDNKADKLPQYIAALIATIGGLVAGTVLAWSSPAGPRLHNGEYGFPVTNDDNSWIGGIMPLGAMAGAPIAGWMVDYFGRKKTALLNIIPVTLGWASIIWAESVMMICAGRLLLGGGIGGYTVCIPLYTSELAEKSIRGTLGSYFQLMINAGILFSYIFGSFLNVFWLSVCSAIIPLVFGAAMMFIPESPAFLLKKGDVDASRDSLQWFRGNKYNIDDEITEMQSKIDQEENEKLSVMEAFSTLAAKKALGIGLGIMFFQQFSGINAVVFYTTRIFKEAGSSLDADMCTIIVGVVCFVTTYIATLIVDRAGRRPMLFGSALFMGVSSTILGVFFYLQLHQYEAITAIGWLPIASVCLFIVVFSLGFGPIPWMFMAEIMPPNILGPASSIACLFNWLCVLMVTGFFDKLVNNLGKDGSFWFFAVISYIGAVFIFFAVPETKGKSIAEIQRELGGSDQTSEATVEVEQKSKV